MFTSHWCRPLFSGPKTVQASVTLLEQMPVFMDKSGSGILHNDILPMLYLALESSMSQVQMAAVSVVPAILDYVRWGLKKKFPTFGLVPPVGKVWKTILFCFLLEGHNWGAFFVSVSV